MADVKPNLWGTVFAISLFQFETPICCLTGDLSQEEEPWIHNGDSRPSNQDPLLLLAVVFLGSCEKPFRCLNRFGPSLVESP